MHDITSISISLIMNEMEYFFMCLLVIINAYSYSLPIFLLVLSVLLFWFIDVWILRKFPSPLPTKLLYQRKLSFKSEGEIKAFPDKQKLREFSNNLWDHLMGTIYVKFQCKEDAEWAVV